MALVAAGVALASQAHAASITVDAGAACTGFAWDPTTSKLTCLVSLDCVVTGPSSAAPGGNITLTAACPTATTITWSGGSCAGQTGGTCTANEASTGHQTYTATPNTAGAPGTKTVNWTNTTTAPSGCSLVASPNSGGPTSQNVLLTAACTSGTTPIALSWSGASGTGGCPTSMSTLSTTCTISGVAASATWNVNFSNSAGNVSKSATYTYSAGGGGAFAGCPSGTVTIDGQWGNTAIATADYGAFDGNMLSIRVAVPANATGTSIRTSSWVEFQSGIVMREASFSTKACDFSAQYALKSLYGAAFKTFTQRPSFQYSIGPATGTSAGLVAGGVYYINIRNNYSDGSPSCGIGDCSMRGGLPQ
jgi:hypothetical protein